MTGFLAAVQFLTRIPVRTARAADLAAAVLWFPIVGALVGAAVGGTAAGLGELVPAAVAATVAVLLGVLITGAFHEDGLADTADAFAGGWTVERRLEILRDPRHGSYGVAALCGSIVLRVVAVGVARPGGGVHRARRRPLARPRRGGGDDGRGAARPARAGWAPTTPGPSGAGRALAAGVVAAVIAAARDRVVGAPARSRGGGCVR